MEYSVKIKNQRSKLRKTSPQSNDSTILHFSFYTLIFLILVQAVEARQVGWAGFLPMRFTLRRTNSMGKQVAHPTYWMLIMLAVWCFASMTQAGESKPDIYVPYEDLAHLIDPADKAVLIDRAEFEALLAEAEANARAFETIELGQVRRGEYLAEVTGDTVTLTGNLEVVSLGEGPVAVPLGFAQIGLTRVTLDGEPASLGYDDRGRVTLIVTTNGSHKLDVTGTTKLTELSSGGMQFGVSLPTAVSGNLKLSAPGDVEIHATVPKLNSHYDNQTDRTDTELTLGGRTQVTVVLLGNGRRQADRAILLGESATTVHLTRSHQTLDCFYTVQVLRRGSRELKFQLPSEWTITEVTCPDLVRWSVDTTEEPPALKTLTVRWRSEKVGTTAIHMTASAPVEQMEQVNGEWHGPRVMLVDASYERGYILVTLDEGLSVRTEALTDARREDVSAMTSVPGAVAGLDGRLYFHWGKKWSLNLELAAIELQKSIKEQQSILVSPEKVTLTGDFEVTAIGRELFDMSFKLPLQWQIKTVRVDKQQTGFEYRVMEETGRRVLHIELPRPIRPEKVANVAIELQLVPSRWSWPSDAAPRSISAPLIKTAAQTVSGDVLISALDDLDAVPQDVPAPLEAVPVGRMASLGIPSSVQYAYRYNRPADGQIQLQVSRRRPRTSSDAVGLVSAGPHDFTGDWRITYSISRASARQLYLLADKSLGQEIDIKSATVPINSKGIAEPNESNLSLSNEQMQRYNLWRLTLDHPATGEVVIRVHYERPRASDSFEVPLVRPVCDEQSNEHLAVQASEELALAMTASQAKEVDAVDLPPLPVEASRILGAFRLDATAAITLKTDVHENYEIPSALATSAELTTYLDVEGGQRTEAKFEIVNAGRQFLTMHLPDGAELWSLRVGDQQAKPQQGAGGDYEVALGTLTKPTAVKIVYTYQPAEPNLERLNLGGVTLPGVEINTVRWTVFPPPDYAVSAQATKMQTSGLLGPKPAFVQLSNAFLKYGFFGPVLMPSLSRVRQGSVRYADSTVSRERAAMESDTSSRRRGGSAGGEMGGMGGYGGRGGAPAPPVVNMPVPTEPQGRPSGPQQAAGVRLAEQGRRTLPVDLVPTPGAGPPVTFTGLGGAELIIGLTSQSRQMSWWALGFIFIATIGIALARRRCRSNVVLIVFVLIAASLLALWLPATTDIANGAFMAGAALVPLYILITFVRCLWNSLFVPRTMI